MPGDSLPRRHVDGFPLSAGTAKVLSLGDHLVVHTPV